MNTFKFIYESGSKEKGTIIETFNFSTNVQTIKSNIVTKTYKHDNNFELSFYVTELLRELRKRNIAYSQSTEKTLTTLNK